MQTMLYFVGEIHKSLCWIFWRIFSAGIKESRKQHIEGWSYLISNRLKSGYEIQCQNCMMLSVLSTYIQIWHYFVPMVEAFTWKMICILILFEILHSQIEWDNTVCLTLKPVLSIIRIFLFIFFNFVIKQSFWHFLSLFPRNFHLNLSKCCLSRFYSQTFLEYK